MQCIAQTMLSHDSHLSIHLSITCRYSTAMAKHIIRLFTPSGSQTILVFFSVWSNTAIFRLPPNGGIACRRYDKIAIFVPYLRNDTRYRNGYNGILTGTYTCPTLATQVCFISNDLEWLSKIFDEYNSHVICKNSAHNPEKCCAYFANFMCIIPLSLV